MWSFRKSYVVSEGPVRGRGLLCLQGVLLRGASRGRKLASDRVLTRLTLCKVATRQGDLCSSLRILRGFKVSVYGDGSSAIGCCITDERFRLPRLGLLISTVRDSGFVARGGDVSLVRGLRKLTDIRSNGRLRQRIFITGETGAVGRQVCCSISGVRGTVTLGHGVSFGCCH